MIANQANLNHEYGAFISHYTLYTVHLMFWPITDWVSPKGNFHWIGWSSFSTSVVLNLVETMKSRKFVQHRLTGWAWLQLLEKSGNCISMKNSGKFGEIYLFSYASLISGRDTSTACTSYCDPKFKSLIPWEMKASPTLLEQYVGSFTSCRVVNTEELWDRALPYRIHPRRLDSLIICRCNYSTVQRQHFLLSYFEDYECWFGQGLIPRPPTR